MSSGAKIGIGVGVGIGAIGLIALGAAFFLIKRKRGGHHPVSQVDDAALPDDTKEKRPRPPSELPGSPPMKYDPHLSGGYGSNYGTGTGTGTGSGFGGNSSTASNWDSPVPTYTAANEPQPGPRPMGADRVHELG